jgi:hypothetical protein
MLLVFFLDDRFLFPDFFFGLVFAGTDANGLMIGVVSMFFSSIIRSLVPPNSPFSKLENSYEEGILVPSLSYHCPTLPSSSELYSYLAVAGLEPVKNFLLGVDSVIAALLFDPFFFFLLPLLPAPPFVYCFLACCL